MTLWTQAFSSYHCVNTHYYDTGTTTFFGGMLQQAQNTYTVAELTLTTAAVIPTKIAVTVRKRKNTCICGRHCKKTTIEGGSEEGREGEWETE